MFEEQQENLQQPCNINKITNDDFGSVRSVKISKNQMFVYIYDQFDNTFYFTIFSCFSIVQILNVLVPVSKYYIRQIAYGSPVSNSIHFGSGFVWMKLYVSFTSRDIYLYINYKQKKTLNKIDKCKAP